MSACRSFVETRVFVGGHDPEFLREAKVTSLSLIVITLRLIRNRPCDGKVLVTTFGVPYILSKLRAIFVLLV